MSPYLTGDVPAGGLRHSRTDEKKALTMSIVTGHDIIDRLYSDSAKEIFQLIEGLPEMDGRERAGPGLFTFQNFVGLSISSCGILFNGTRGRFHGYLSTTRDEETQPVGAFSGHYQWKNKAICRLRMFGHECLFIRWGDVNTNVILDGNHLGCVENISSRRLVFKGSSGFNSGVDYPFGFWKKVNFSINGIPISYPSGWLYGEKWPDDTAQAIVQLQQCDQEFLSFGLLWIEIEKRLES